MRGHAGGLADRLAIERRRQAAFVQRVPGLVHHGQHRRGEIRLVIARGDAHVGGRAAGERVRRAVQPRVVEIEAEPLRQPAAQRLLCGDRERALRAQRRGLARLALFRLRQRPAQEALIVGEHRRHVGGAQAALEAVHQRIVGRQAQRRRQRRGGLAHQPHHLLQRRAHAGEIRFAARLAPDLLAGGVGARLRFHQVARQCGRADMGLAHQPQIGGAPGIVRRRRRLPPRQDRRPAPARSAANAPGRRARQAGRRAPRRRRAASSSRRPSRARTTPRRSWRCG